MNCKPMLASMAILLAIIAPREAAPQNGIVENQFDYYEVHDYIECLGEPIEHYATITTRTHSIVRPDGGVHEVLHWFIDGITVGLDSGMTWSTQHAPSPWIVNTNGDQSSQGFNLRIMWRPLDGGRRFRETWRLWLVTDANGVPRVEHDTFEIRCVGP